MFGSAMLPKIFYGYVELMLVFIVIQLVLWKLHMYIVSSPSSELYTYSNGFLQCSKANMNIHVE